MLKNRKCQGSESSLPPAVCPECCCSWSAISRRERYLKRCTEAGDEVPEDADQNLLPGRACVAVGLQSKQGHSVDIRMITVVGRCWPAALRCWGWQRPHPAGKNWHVRWLQHRYERACVDRCAEICSGKGCSHHLHTFTYFFAACSFIWHWIAACAGVLDPVTLEPVVNPAISPAGGYACSSLSGCCCMPCQQQQYELGLQQTQACN